MNPKTWKMIPTLNERLPDLCILEVSDDESLPSILIGDEDSEAVGEEKDKTLRSLLVRQDRRRCDTAVKTVSSSDS